MCARISSRVSARADTNARNSQGSNRIQTWLRLCGYRVSKHLMLAVEDGLDVGDESPALVAGIQNRLGLRVHFRLRLRNPAQKLSFDEDLLAGQHGDRLRLRLIVEKNARDREDKRKDQRDHYVVLPTG